MTGGRDGFTSLGKTTYLLRSKAWSFRGKYYIRDEHNEDLFFIKNHFSLWNDKLTMLDKSEIAKLDIIQKFNWFTSRYTILRQGAAIAEFAEKCVFCGSTFHMTCIGTTNTGTNTGNTGTGTGSDTGSDTGTGGGAG
eukprot:Selendium_serpulae@DN5724_c2_g1_i1.p1